MSEYILSQIKPTDRRALRQMDALLQKKESNVTRI